MTPLFGHKPKSIRERFAAQYVVVADRARGRLQDDRKSLARLWNRDGRRLARQAMQAERRAAAALQEGWKVARPRIEKGAKQGWAVVRPQVIAAERNAGVILVKAGKRLRAAA